MGTDDKPDCVVPRNLPRWFDRDPLKLNRAQGEALDQFKAWLFSAAQGNVAGVLRGKEHRIDQPKEGMKELVGQVLKTFPAKTAQPMLQVLSRVVRRCNDYSTLDLPLPEFAIRIPPVANPFITDRWGGIDKVRRWRKMLLADIKRNPFLNDQAQARGRVLASAVLFGSLVSRESLTAFYGLLPLWNQHAELVECGEPDSASDAPGRRGGRGPRPSVFAIAWTDSGSNYQRWFPDTLTAVLLLRLCREHLVSDSPQTQKKNKRKLSTDLERDLLNYMRAIMPGGDLPPEKLREVLDAALLDLEVRMPRALTEYAAGKLVSHSLRPKAWHRIMHSPSFDTELRSDTTSGKAVEQAPNESHSKTDEVSPEHVASSDEANGDNEEEVGNEPDWLEELREHLRPSGLQGDKTVALHRIERCLRKPEIPAELKIFAGFAKELLATHTKPGHRITLKTLRTRVISIATRLPALVSLDEPGAFNRDMLQGAYQQILEDSASENQRQKLVVCLRAFHHYLVNTPYAVEELDEGEAFGSANEDLTVDSNLILEDEYLQAAASLKKSPLPDGKQTNERLRTIARLLLTMGFRCGLRRMEALKLQRNDLLESDPAELLIRPWEHRRLKTPNAVRKLPLYALLSPGELQELRRWKKMREAESATETIPSPYLFTLPCSPYTAVPENLVFPLIHDALRSATRDKDLHFHHLRHAFCSNLLHALLRPPKMQTPDWLKRWDAHAFVSAGFRKKLYQSDSPTRRHLFGICRLLGHGSPAMSISNYGHTCDQLLALWRDSQLKDLCNEGGFRFDRKFWVFATGMNQRTVYHILRYEGPLGLVRHLWKQLPHCTVVPRITPSEQEPKGSDSQEGVELEIDNIWRLLHLGLNLQVGSEDLAHRFLLNETLVKRLLVEAGKLAKGPESEPIQFLLRMPRGGHERAVFRRFAPCLWELLNKDAKSYLPVLQHYIDEAGNERNGLEFPQREVGLAVKYLDFLDKLGVRAGERRFMFHSKAGRGFWTMSLKIANKELIRSACPRTNQKAKDNVVGIKVVVKDVDLVGGGNKLRASHGLRYLLTIAAIWAVALKSGVDENASLAAPQ
jgi:integrase